ncbi:spermatogenesis-associated protein 31A1-like [Erethizon dorsatum]
MVYMGSSLPMTAAKPPIYYSLLKLLPDQESSQQPLYQHCPPAVCKRTPVTAPQPYGEHVDTAALSLVETAPSPLTQHLLPLASSTSPGWSKTSSDFVCSPTSCTASQSPEPLLPLERISTRPLTLSLSPPCPPDPATAPQPWWDTKEKPEQELGPHQLSYPKILGTQFQQKWNQLFWGLPSLHSESLVAAAWISQNPSPLQPPPILFNKISNVCPVKVQDKMSPQPLSCLDPQTPPLILSTAKFQAPPLGQDQTEANLQSFPPPLLPHYLPHIRDCGAAWPAPHNNPHLICTETQHPGGPLLTESGRASPSVIQGSQEDGSPFAPNLCQNHWATAILPEGFSISPEHRKPLEQCIQDSLIQRQWDLPCRIQEPLELTQPQCDIAHTCQAKDKPGSSECASLCTGGCSKDVQEVKFQLEKGHILDKVPEDPSRALESSSVKFLGVTSAESERNLTRPTESDSRHDKNHQEGILKAHMAVKSRQLQEGLIPLRLRRSWLSVHGAFSTHMDTRNIAFFRSQKPCVSTFQKLPSFNPSTLKTLEAHVTRVWVRHKWGLPLKLLRAINLFKVKKAPPSSLPQYSCSSSAIGVSWGDNEVAKFLGKAPQACLIEEVTVNESVPTLGRLLVSSPVCKETERALKGTPPGDVQGLLKAPPAGQGSRQPSQQLIHSLTGTTCDSRTTLGTSRGGLEVPVVPRTCVAQDGGEPGLQVDIGSEFQHRVKTKSVNQSQVCIPDVCLPDSSTDSVQAPDSLSSVASQCHLHSMSFGDMLASQMLGDLKADRERSLGQQKLRTPRHQYSQKKKSKMSALDDKGEASRRPSPKKIEDLGTSTPTQEGTEDTLEWKRIQLLPVPLEGYFQRSVRTFLQWISPKKKIKGPEEPQRKGKTASSSAQSQRLAKSSPSVYHNNAEAQRLMRNSGPMGKANKLPQHELCDLVLNQPKKEEGQASVSWVSCSHRPSGPSEHRTTLGCAATPKCHGSPIRERHPSDQESLKTGQFINEQQGRKHPHLVLSNQPVFPVSPSQ